MIICCKQFVPEMIIRCRRMFVLKHKFCPNKFIRWFPMLLLATSVGFFLKMYQYSRPDGAGLKKLKSRMGIVQPRTNQGKVQPQSCGDFFVTARKRI